ncbi:MAG TPA: hypothetical protein VIT90_08060 [Lysobacter sp.]
MSMKLTITALIVGTLIVAAPGCGDKCRNETVAVVPSPSGKARAIVFHRKCGATTDANTQVAVLPLSASHANIPGNALIVAGDVPLQVRWDSDASLQISGLGDARVFKQNDAAADVSIAYAR